MYVASSRVTVIFILPLINTEAKKPPGYVSPTTEYDPNPPNYEYGYRIQEAKATQGKDEKRDGIYAQGRYYVEKGLESSHKVKYFADDWGYHPVVEYSNRGPYSKSSTNFVLGVEAIKLKNNQVKKYSFNARSGDITARGVSRGLLHAEGIEAVLTEKFIPQDPYDPGKSHNFAKLDPSSQRQPENQEYLLQADPSSHAQIPPTYFQQVIVNEPKDPVILKSPETQHPTVDQLNPSQLQQVLVDPFQLQNNLTPLSVTPNSVSSLNQLTTVDNQLQVIKNDDPNTLSLSSTPNPVFLFDKQTQVTANDPSDNHTADETPIEDKVPEVVNQSQPVFYYVQPQLNQPQFVEAAFPSASAENQLVYPVEQIYPFADLQQVVHNVYEHGQNSQPQAQALTSFNEEIKDNNEDTSEKSVSAAASKNLIESTKNLVSGNDVLNINAAIQQGDYLKDEIDSSSLNSLLNQYVTPTIVDNHIDVNNNHVNIVSSTTVAPPINTNQTSLLHEPIVVAESQDDLVNKPVIEKTEENNDFFSSTSRTFLAKSSTTASESVKNSLDDEILVTPRPVSSTFLAPITAGVQLQHIDSPVFDDAQSDKTQLRNKKKEKVVVQVQKTISNYLGMYEYPSAYAAQYSSNNMTENAMENIELGKTLLYFPGPESSTLKSVVTEHVSEGSQQFSIDNVETQQQAKESKVQQQVYLQTHDVLPTQITEVVHNSIPLPYYPVENVPYPQPYTAQQMIDYPIETAKLFDRNYPIKNYISYPQPHFAKKIVQNNLKEPYSWPIYGHHEVPVQNILERKAHGSPIEKTIDTYSRHGFPGVSTQQAYFLQIPNLYTPQKYSSLVHNSFQPPYPAQSLHQLHQKAHPYSYASHINQYLPPKQDIRLAGGQLPPRLKKLNLLVLPGVKVPLNLPPVTKNLYDIRQGHSFESFRHSNAQLDNGYLPAAFPLKGGENNEKLHASASYTNHVTVNIPNEDSGLVPPKRPIKDPKTYRTARSQFNDKSIRLEYGFIPPLVPSLEIDDQGQPIEKDDNKK